MIIPQFDIKKIEPTRPYLLSHLATIVLGSSSKRSTIAKRVKRCDPKYITTHEYGKGRETIVVIGKGFIDMIKKRRKHYDV